MIEVKNKQRGPVQLVVRSKEAPNSFTTLIIPGIGKGQNTRLLEDEEVVPEILERIKKTGIISTRYIPSTEIKEFQSDKLSQKGD